MEKLTMYGNSMRLIEVCVMKSLVSDSCDVSSILAGCTMFRGEKYCEQRKQAKTLRFCLFFCCLSVFYYPVKTGYVTANLTDSFCSNNAFVSGNHSSCVVALEPLAKSKSRTA